MKIFKKIKLLQIGFAAVLILLMVQNTQATILITDPVKDSSGDYPSPFTAGPDELGQCNKTLVTLSGSDADYCAGYYSLANSGESTETEAVNQVTDGLPWEYLLKVQDETPSDTQEYLVGIELTLMDVDLGDLNGDWTFSWADTNGLVDSNLPLYIDLAFAFKAGTGQSDGGIAYFFFDDFLLTDDPYSAAGTFSLQVDHGLSHESLFVRAGTAPPERPPIPPAGVPEPGMVALFGMGLLGMGLSQLRRRRKAA